MLWLAQEDVNQRDEMLCFGLRSEDLNAPLSPFPDLSYHDVERLILPADFPPRRFRLDGRMLPDFWRTARGDFVVSAALRDAMRLPPDVAQVMPILLDCPSPAAHAKGYALLRVLLDAPALDRQRSGIQTERIVDARTQRPVLFEHIRRFVVDPATVAPADLFRAAEDSHVLIATDALAARVLAGGCQGMVFGTPSDLDTWGHPRTRRTASGGQVPYGKEPFGVQPAPAPAQRPPFTPDPALPAALRPIEAAIRHRLPDYYVRFLLDPPAALLRHRDSRYALLIKPDHVAEENRGVRALVDGNFFRGRDVPWPADWLVIGWDGAGNLFAMDLGAPSPPVLFWDHEMGVASVQSPSLAAYAEHIVRGATEDDLLDDDDDD